MNCNRRFDDTDTSYMLLDDIVRQSVPFTEIEIIDPRNDTEL